MHRLKKEKPQLEIIINGGIKTLDVAREQLQHVDGVMIGREAYHNPYMLAEVDKTIYKDEEAEVVSRQEVVERLCEYIDEQLSDEVDLHSITRHILGLYTGCRGARLWRRYLSENSHRKGADSSLVREALKFVEPVDETPSGG